MNFYYINQNSIIINFMLHSSPSFLSIISQKEPFFKYKLHLYEYENFPRMIRMTCVALKDRFPLDNHK